MSEVGKMSRQLKKAVEQIKAYYLKTQCRRCIYGEVEDYGQDHGDYVGCKLQHNNPCDWETEVEERLDRNE